VRELATLDWERVAAHAARSMARGMVSKFQPCLPEEAEDRLLAERLLDLAGTLHFLGTATVSGVRAALRPPGTRLRDAETNGPLALDLPVVTSPAGAASPKNDVQWIDTPAALRSVLAELMAEEVVGLDIETALDFGTLCLIQIATRTRTYLIDPFAIGDLAPLHPFMTALRPRKVIHNARFERRVLATLGITIDGVFDTLEASRRLRGPDVVGGHGLGMVCERELGLTLDKGEQTSDWGRRPLGAEQLRYAALDAEVLLALFDRFGLSPVQSMNAPTES
jgi:ATP-dependent Lhr-like helicase